MKYLPLMIALLCMPFVAAQAEEDVVEVSNVRENIYLLVSPMGGNVVVSSGEDGAFLVDDNLSPRSALISGTAKKMSGKDIKFIVNTHYHFDHTGGNELMGGEGAVIVAHDNVRKRLSEEQFISFFSRKMEPLSKAGLPVVTFSKDVTLHYNDDDISVIHVPNGHTDGDAFVHFNKQNVIVSGDVIFNGMYPFIDIEHGGAIKGVLAAQDEIIKLADDKTVIVPGHGPVMSVEDVKAYRATLAKIMSKVEEAIKDSKTKEETVKELDAKVLETALAGHVVSHEAFIGLVYDDLSR